MNHFSEFSNLLLKKRQYSRFNIDISLNKEIDSCIDKIGTIDLLKVKRNHQISTKIYELEVFLGYLDGVNESTVPHQDVSNSLLSYELFNLYSMLVTGKSTQTVACSNYIKQNMGQISHLLEGSRFEKRRKLLELKVFLYYGVNDFILNKLLTELEGVYSVCRKLEYDEEMDF